VSERNAVQRAIDRFGSEAGFEKKSGSWYRYADEVISVFNVQKSQYGPQYYFNQSFWLRRLGEERYPKAHQAHVVARLEGLLPDLEIRIRELFDLEYDMPEERRVDEIVAILRNRLLPVIERGSSVVGLRSLLDDGIFAAAGIRGPAQEALTAAR
jgi:hypothetical protein